MSPYISRCAGDRNWPRPSRPLRGKPAICFLIQCPNGCRDSRNISAACQEAEHCPEDRGAEFSGVAAEAAQVEEELVKLTEDAQQASLKSRQSGPVRLIDIDRGPLTRTLPDALGAQAQRLEARWIEHCFVLRDFASSEPKIDRSRGGFSLLRLAASSQMGRELRTEHGAFDFRQWRDPSNVQARRPLDEMVILRWSFGAACHARQKGPRLNVRSHWPAGS